MRVINHRRTKPAAGPFECLNRDTLGNGFGRTCIRARPYQPFTWCEPCAERKGEERRAGRTQERRR